MVVSDYKYYLEAGRNADMPPRSVNSSVEPDHAHLATTTLERSLWDIYIPEICSYSDTLPYISYNPNALALKHLTGAVYIPSHRLPLFIFCRIRHITNRI